MRDWAFHYGGSTFIPFRKLSEEEGNHQPIHKTFHDRELGIMSRSYPDSKHPYSYDSFYKAATAKDCDLFLCKENGRLYIPGENELFRWTGETGQQDTVYTEPRTKRKSEYVR